MEGLKQLHHILGYVRISKQIFVFQSLVLLQNLHVWSIYLEQIMSASILIHGIVGNHWFTNSTFLHKRIGCLVKNHRVIIFLFEKLLVLEFFIKLADGFFEVLIFAHKLP